ncbi:MAG: bifunctional 4-hydroxy-2-oxoglutarate aldolase/2-dehydro-3-deoxy-phosphogluconate aldolase [Oscillospiraceae bacterium]|jgi:2-dehydro-3-deoxyphosphogluconate aldolase/(4S)-4-hydroxy-2-oxoglutarate aldolase|nr:bifunctional 4-hydroxy-2-oxoglutarate aldolase/2-dehydro-3-deoxy-phosphogluconate aldolase [Oscillospiraceae bacterium]
MTIRQKILQSKLIAIVRGLPEKHLLTLADALLAGGISLMEITFDQRNPETWQTTAAGIASLEKSFGGAICAGAGTVMTLEQLRLAADAGARYIISPNADADIIRATKGLGLVSMPGAMTPTECAAAHNAGADFIKLFPAGVLGADYLKAIKAPLAHLQFMAVGGVSVANIPAFIAAGAVGFGIGGNLVNKAWIEAGETSKITALARAYADAVIH